MYRQRARMQQGISKLVGVQCLRFRGGGGLPGVQLQRSGSAFLQVEGLVEEAHPCSRGDIARAPPPTRLEAAVQQVLLGSLERRLAALPDDEEIALRRREHRPRVEKLLREEGIPFGPALSAADPPPGAFLHSYVSDYLELSATAIRRKRSHGQDVSPYVERNVHKIMEEIKLYEEG